MKRAIVLVALLAWAVPFDGAVAAKEASPAKPPAQEQRPAQSCPQPLRNGCEAQQGACRLACPPIWSTNPGAPAFTPTDRAGCTRDCMMRYLSCLRLYGCS